MKKEGKILFEFVKQPYETPELYMAGPEYKILVFSGYIDESEEFEYEDGDWGEEEGGGSNSNGLFGSGSNSPWWMP